jgi:hypothetical protein
MLETSVFVALDSGRGEIGVFEKEGELVESGVRHKGVSGNNGAAEIT